MSTTHNRDVEYPERVTISFDEQTYRALVEEAERLDRSLAWIVREAVREWLAASEK